jgi:hypothetical protein
MSLTAPSDYIGQFKIPVNQFTTTDLQSYIDKYEKKYLTDLLGVELYDLFIADIVSNVPVTAIYLAIYNAFAEDDTVGSGCQHRSEGMKEMIKGFVYFHFTRDLYSQSQMNGKVKNEFSNSTQARMLETNMNDNFNESVKTYKQIQWYIDDNLTLYPTFNGFDKEYISWL